MQFYRTGLGRALGAIAGLAFMGASGLSAPGLAAEVTLKAGVFVPPQTTYGVPFQLWVDAVNEVGKGFVQVRVLGGPEAIPGHELAGAVRSGVLDVAAVPPAYYKTFMVEGDTQILSDMNLAEQRASGAFAALNAVANERLNAEHVTSYGLGVKFHIYLRKNISSVADLKGLRLRSQPNYTAFLQSLGVDPVNMPAPDVYTALERGVVDGFVWPLWGITDFGWEKFTAVRVHPGFYDVVVNIILNKKKLDSLDAAQQDALRKATATFEARYEDWAKQKSGDVLAKQSAANIVQIDFAPDFADLAYTSYWQQLEEASPEKVRQLRKLLTK